MNAKQRKIVRDSGIDSDELVLTSEGWSHNGFLAWQLELCDEAKRGVTDSSRIAAVLRRLDDAE